MIGMEESRKSDTLELRELGRFGASGIPCIRHILFKSDLEAQA